jgi:phosphomannomutase
MDGTLTAPREKMSISNEIMLGQLQHKGFEVGIITGSDMNYVKQQCATLFDMSLIQTNETHFLPCNGTKYILNGETIYSQNMKEYMGVENWRKMIVFLIQQQYRLCLEPPVAIEDRWDIPLTGHFFNYRASLLNWCPIGRNASQDDRKIWEKIDKDSRVRKEILIRIQSFVESLGCDINVKLGGDTSFDIFPVGWDKTYPIDCTNYFDDYESIYFIGDRCQPNGNDYELYNHPRIEGFETESPEMTIEIVNKILSQDV